MITFDIVTTILDCAASVPLFCSSFYSFPSPFVFCFRPSYRVTNNKQAKNLNARKNQGKASVFRRWFFRVSSQETM